MRGGEEEGGGEETGEYGGRRVGREKGGELRRGAAMREGRGVPTLDKLD